MTQAGLEFINSCMEKLNIPYQFMCWKAKLPDTFFIGQYTEVPSDSEAGYEETDFNITGTTKESYSKLEDVKKKIKNFFTTEGLTKVFEDGSGIAVIYSNSYPIPSIEEGVYRIQVTLKVKEWSC